MFDARILTPAGQIDARDATLDCTLYRETWNNSCVYEESALPIPLDSRILEPLGNSTAEIVNGRGEISLTPPSSGIVRSAGTRSRFQIR